MSNPALGYVNRPVQVIFRTTEYYDLFLFFPHQVDQEAQLIGELRKRNPLLLQRFERNGKFVELYQSP
jgi:hypothetical protein